MEQDILNRCSAAKPYWLPLHLRVHCRNYHLNFPRPAPIWFCRSVGRATVICYGGRGFKPHLYNGPGCFKMCLSDRLGTFTCKAIFGWIISFVSIARRSFRKMFWKPGLIEYVVVYLFVLLLFSIYLFVLLLGGVHISLAFLHWVSPPSNDCLNMELLHIARL